MNKHIEELVIQAMGTKKHRPPVWQFYDVELDNFAKLILQDCIRCIEHTNRHHAHTSYDLQLIETTIRKSVLEIKERFEL